MSSRSLLYTVLALASCSADAAELELVLSTYSWHAEAHYTASTAKAMPGDPPATAARPRAKNAENFGAGLSYELAPGTRLVAGAYRNSAWRSSRYAMLSYELAPHVALAGGYLDGYRRTPLGAALVLELGVARLIATPGTCALWFSIPLHRAGRNSS